MWHMATSHIMYWSSSFHTLTADHSKWHDIYLYMAWKGQLFHFITDIIYCRSLRYLIPLTLYFKYTSWSQTLRIFVNTERFFIVFKMVAVFFKCTYCILSPLAYGIGFWLSRTSLLDSAISHEFAFTCGLYPSTLSYKMDANLWERFFVILFNSLSEVMNGQIEIWWKINRLE